MRYGMERTSKNPVRLLMKRGEQPVPGDVPNLFQRRIACLVETFVVGQLAAERVWSYDQDIAP